MIQVRELRVDYDEVCAVRDLSLDIGAGEIFGLIGPNGAGKTSTLKALIGLVEPTYGEVVLGGIDTWQHPREASRLVGFMPDFSPIYEDLTVWEFLDLFAASYEMPRDQRDAAIDRQLEAVNLTEKRNAMTAELSRGMKQRLILAKTLLPDPQILLLDEPASGMDPFGRALLKDILRQQAGRGKVVLISSHILPELSDLCTSVGIMEKGVMVTAGRVDEVTTRVLGEGSLKIEVVSGAAVLAEMLTADPRVGEVRREGNTFEFPFGGGREEASDLLTAIVSAGVRVASFMRAQEGLEEVFMKIGAKEVS